MRRTDIKTLHKPKRHFKAFLFLFFCFVIFAVVFMSMRMKPLLKTLALSTAENLAYNAINSAAGEVMKKNNIDYQDLVCMNINADGMVTSIKINSMNANKLKSEMSAAISEKISNIDRKKISIPIGSLTGIDFLTGRGPKINFYINLSCSSSAEIVSDFSTAGINQVCHSIKMDVSANVYIITAGQNSSTTVKDSIKIAETVIVGSIPEIYAGANDELWSNLID